MKVSSIRLISKSVSKVLNENLRLSLAETPKYVTAIKEDVIYKKIGDLNRWYTRIIGLDEVKYYQDRVVNLQDKLLEAQERRREIAAALTSIRRKSNELQDQIHKVKRQDDLQKFLDLMKEETEILRQENEISRSFSDCDREEREIFTAFANAIRDSHEKQRAQLEYTKYFGLVLSIAGSFLTFMYTTLKKNDLKSFIERNMEEMSVGAVNASNLSVPVVKDLEENKRQLNEMFKYINSENQRVLNVINRNHREMKGLIAKNTTNEMSSDVSNLNEMPDGEKILWFSVISLVSLMILRKFFN